MEKLDLHNVSHENAPIIINDFILQNFYTLPIEVITGNSVNMQAILQNVIDNYDLRMVPTHANNLGSYIINNKL